MGFKNFLRDYFTFNRRERNGVFILLSIILVLILYLSFSGFFFPKEKIDFSKFEKEITQFEAEQKQISDSVSAAKEDHFFSGNILTDNSSSGETPKKQYPNEKQANYHSNYPANTFPKKDGAIVIELNSADTSDLKKLKGIGSGFAKRIVKFRDMLGGFVKKEQLLEVYGFDKEKFDLVSSQIEIDLLKVKKININSASVDDLKRSPYMNKNTATAIFNYRVSKGDFKNVQEIKELNLADEELYSKIALYLKVE